MKAFSAYFSATAAIALLTSSSPEILPILAQAKIVDVTVPILDAAAAVADALIDAVGAKNATKAATASPAGPFSSTGFCDGHVHELGFDNFHAILNSSSFSCVLFYDEHALKQQQAAAIAGKKKDETQYGDTLRMYNVLQRVAATFGKQQPTAFNMRNMRLSFGALNTRRHTYLRGMYLDEHATGEAFDDFYQNYEDLDESDGDLPEGMISSETFMKIPSAQLPTFPPRLLILHDFNVLSAIELDNVDVDVFQEASVIDWMLAKIKQNAHFVMTGPGAEPLPFGGNEKGPKVQLRSFVHEEERKRENHVANHAAIMASINWTVADEMMEKRQNEPFSFASTKLFDISRDEAGDSFYKYKFNTELDKESDAFLLGKLSDIMVSYLAYANSYENLWSDERRAAEDERTGYGPLLQRLDANIRNLVESAYADLPDEGDEEDGDFLPLVTWDDVPDLQDWFEDMLFGFGRSPSSLHAYLKAHVFETRKSVDDLQNLRLFQRVREYMAVRENCGTDDDEEGSSVGGGYGMFFRTLIIQMAALLAEFQEHLTRNYLTYLNEHPEEMINRYDGFLPVDTFDMKDPKNFDLLTDYDAFEEQYVAKRKPFRLSNVEMTKPFNYTMDFLVEQCGFMDVTEDTAQSRSLGNKDVTEWGGLTEYSLPRELMTENRKKTDNEGKVEWDKKMNLEQFVELAKRRDDLYLHDFGLQTVCSRLFWNETPYDPLHNQFFHIPSVIGRYDLIQRVAQSSYASSWPSLFVGRKGSNSKLHRDSGSTAFWMYLVSGTKRWIVYDVSERPYLYESYLDTRYVADVLSLNATQEVGDRKRVHEYFDATHPLLCRANAQKGTAYEIIQKPGDLVFMPPDTPHAVENLEDSVGLAFNSVPRAGISIHLYNQIHEDHKFASLELILQYLISEPGSLDLLEANPDDPLYTTLGKYLSQ